MGIANTHFEAAVESLSRRIVEAEMRSTAAAVAFAALIRVNLDTAEAERHLSTELDTLQVLRGELSEFRSQGG